MSARAISGAGYSKCVVALIALGALGLALPDAEATTPSLTSWTVNLNNTGTAGGTLTLVFNTPVRVQTDEATTLEGIILLNGRVSDANNPVPMTGNTMSISGATVTIPFTPDQKARIAFQTEVATILHVSSTAFESVDTGTAYGGLDRQGGSYSNQQIAGFRSIRSYTPDTTAPNVVTATLVRSSGAMQIITDDALNPASAQDGSRNPSNGNASRYHIRDGTGQSSGGSNLENISIQSNITSFSVGQNRHIVSSTLSSELLATVIAMQNPTLYVDANTLHDMRPSPGVSPGTVEFGQPLPHNTAVSDIAINYTPALSGAEYNSGTLTVTFSEAVTAGSASGTPMFVSSAGRASSYTYSSSSDVALAAPTSSASSQAYTLTGAEQTLFTGMTNPTLYVRAGALKDSANVEGASEDTPVSSAAPTLVSASLRPGNGILTVTFSGGVSAVVASQGVTPGQIFVAPFASSAPAYSGTNHVLFTAGSSAAVSHTNTLDAAALARIRGMTNPTLYMEASAVTTASTVNAAGSTDLPNAAPDIASAALNEGTGAMTITFNDNISAGSGNVDLRDGAGAAHDTTTDVRVAVSATTVSGTTMTFTLGEADRQRAIAMSDPYVYLPTVGVVTAGTGSLQTNSAANESADITITPDNIPPRVTGVAFDQSTGVLTITFSETVKAGDADVTQRGIHMHNGSVTEPRSHSNLQGATVTSTGNSQTITLQFTESMRQQAVGFADMHISVLQITETLTSPTGPFTVYGSDITDTTGVPVAFRINIDVTVVADSTPPQIHASTAPTLNEGTGVLVLTFNENVKTGSADVDLTKIFINDGSGIMDGTALGATEQVPALGDATVTSTGNGAAVTITLNEAQRQAAIGYGAPHVYFAAGAVKDIADNGIGASTDPTESTEITDTADTTPPQLITDPKPVFLQGPGTLTLVFNEVVKAGDADVNQNQIFMHNVAQTTGGTALTAATVTSSGESTTVVLTLTETQRLAAVGYGNNMHIYLQAGAVKDRNNTDMGATGAVAVTSTADTTKPQISSTAPTLNEGTGVLVITFNENVKAGADVDLTKIFINGDTSTSGGTVLTGATVTSSGNVAAVSITLTETQRQAAIGYTTPYLYFTAGAVEDPSTNDIEALAPGVRITDTPDSVAPTLSSAAFDEGTGVLVLTFSETVRNGAATNGAVDIRNGAGASHTASSVRITADPSISGAVATYPALSEADRQKVISLLDPYVYLDASVIEDTSGTDNAALTGGFVVSDTPDAVNPALSSASIHEGTGAWTVTFTETVSSGSATGTVLYMAESGSASGVALTVPSSAVSSSGTLSEADRQTVISMNTPTVYAVQNAVQDTANNGNAAGSVVAAQTLDRIAPRLHASTAPTLNEGTGVLVLTFDETVKAGADEVLQEDVFITDGSTASGGTGLGGAAVTSTGNATSVSITLTETQRQAAIGYGDPHVYFEAGAVKDTTDTGIALSSAGAQIIDTPDSVKPQLQSAAVNLGAATLRLVFDESISAVDLSKILINNATPNDNNENPLTGATWQQPSTISPNVEITGLPQSVIVAISQLTSARINLQVNAVVDSSSNGIAPVVDAALSVTTDSDPPQLRSASFDAESGRLDLTFNEAVSEPVAGSVFIAGSAVSGAASASGSTASITLDELHRVRTVEAISGTSVQVSISANAVTDISLNPVAASSISATVTPDSNAPTLESASLDLGTGELTLAFDESVASGDLSDISVGTRALDADSATSGDKTARLTITLSEAARQAAISGPGTVTITVSGSAVSDISGNLASGSAQVTPSPDSAKPAVERARLNTDTGVLRVLLNEWADGTIDTASMQIRGLPSPITLSLSSAVTDAETVRVTLAASELAQVQTAFPLTLHLVGGAGITDTSDNALDETTLQLGIDDPIPPELLSARITGPSSVLLEFSEDLLNSTVMSSAFEVGGFVVSRAEEISPGRVLLTVEGLPEGRPQSVSAAQSVTDNSDNPVVPGSVTAPWMPARITVTSLEMSSDGANALLAKAGDTITVRLLAETDGSDIVDVEVELAGQRAQVSVSDDGFAATYEVGAPGDGPVSLLATVRNQAGFSVTLTEMDLTSRQVTIDTMSPSIETARFAGSTKIMLVFSEPVLTTSDDYTLTVDGSAVSPAVSGSGTTTVLLSWTGAAADPSTSSASVTAGASLTDLAGNAGPSSATASGVQTELNLEPLLTGPVVQTGSGPAVSTTVPLAETISTVTIAPSPLHALILDLSSLTSVVSDAKAALCALGGPECASSGDAQMSSPLTIETGMNLVTRVVLPANLQVAGLPLDELVRIHEAEQHRVQQALDDADFADSEAGGYDLASARAAELGSASADIVFSSLVRVQFDPSVLYDGTLVFSVDSAGEAKRLTECDPDPVSALAALEPSPTVDALACVDYDSSSVWTRHFTAFGVAPQFSSGGSECDDCTAPTLGFDSSGARLVSEGFAYNGLASDVQHFFTPYPLITSEVGDENTVSLKIYENSGPSNVSHVAVAFGLRSGQVISESLAVINYDIRHDGTGVVSVIDPQNSLDAPSASHEIVECSEGSELRCMLVTIDHSFRSPLEFDIVGTDVWDTERNSWQNYFNHGIRVTGETLNPVPGVRVNGGELVLHPIVEGSNNVKVMADEDHNLYRLSPGGLYEPLRNVSSLFHNIDESMYSPDGEPMQGYDRRDAEFADAVEEQIELARAILAEMDLGRQSWNLVEAESSVHVVLDRLESLRGDIEAERERAEQRHAQMYAPTERPE